MTRCPLCKEEIHFVDSRLVNNPENTEYVHRECEDQLVLPFLDILILKPPRDFSSRIQAGV